MARLKKRKDGRYCKQVYIGMQDGKKKYKQFFGASAREAETKAIEFKTAMGRGLDPSRGRVTFKDAADAYRAMKKASGIGHSWLRSIGNHIDNLEPIWEMTPDKILTSHIQSILNGLAEWHMTVPPLTHKTMREILNTCSGIFESIIPEVVQYNPCAKVVVPAGKPSTSRSAIPDIQQKWIRDTPHRAQRAAMLMLYSGLRRGEAAALTWADIDFDAATITVNKAVDYARPKMRIKKPKTAAGIRTVNIPSILVDFLRSERKKDNCLYVCHNTRGEIMTSYSWDHLWESYMIDLNVKYGYDGKESKYGHRKKDKDGKTRGALKMRIQTFTPHQLRHTFCTLLYFSGVDILTARDQMGHANIKTTLEIYTHLDKQYKKHSMNKLDEYLYNADTMHG